MCTPTWLRVRPRPAGATLTTSASCSYPAVLPERLRIYWVQDNLSATWTPDIRPFAEANNIELVPTPTYASYLNRVEYHFPPMSEFVVKNFDYLYWDAFNCGLVRHITNRNGAQRLLDLERRHQIAA